MSLREELGDEEYERLLRMRREMDEGACFPLSYPMRAHERTVPGLATLPDSYVESEDW